MNIPAPDWARDVRLVAVLTGAGISTASGIPDYRGPDGVWTRRPEAAAAFTYDRFLSEEATRRVFWRTYVGHAAWNAVPNAAHEALARLSRSLAVRVITQNVDGLHQRSGLPARKVLELHGSMHSAVCVTCDERQPARQVVDRCVAGEDDPRCRSCGGILKLATVLFGERLDSTVMAQAASIVQASQLMLAVGSSLVVEPAASLCRLAVESGARLVIVNRDETPYDDLAVQIYRTDIVTTVPSIVDALVGQRGPTAEPGR